MQNSQTLIEVVKVFLNTPLEPHVKQAITWVLQQVENRDNMQVKYDKLRQELTEGSYFNTDINGDEDIANDLEKFNELIINRCVDIDILLGSFDKPSIYSALILSQFGIYLPFKPGYLRYEKRRLYCNTFSELARSRPEEVKPYYKYLSENLKYLEEDLEES